MNDFQSDQINELVGALAKAQVSMGPAIKDSVNPHFKSRFADLGSVWNACKDALNSNGLVVTQAPYQMDLGLFLVTTLAHVSGQWLRSYTPIINTKGDAQGLGSAITYARRYGLSAMVGVVPEDDDAEIAVQKPTFQKPSVVKAAPKVANETYKEMHESLKIMLDSEDIDTSELDDYIQERANATGKNSSDVARSALMPSLYERFKSSYIAYLKQMEQHSVAV